MRPSRLIQAHNGPFGTRGWCTKSRRSTKACVLRLMLMHKVLVRCNGQWENVDFSQAVDEKGLCHPFCHQALTVHICILPAQYTFAVQTTLLKMKPYFRWSTKHSLLVSYRTVKTNPLLLFLLEQHKHFPPIVVMFSSRLLLELLLLFHLSLGIIRWMLSAWLAGRVSRNARTWPGSGSSNGWTLRSTSEYIHHPNVELFSSPLFCT